MITEKQEFLFLEKDDYEQPPVFIKHTALHSWSPNIYNSYIGRPVDSIWINWYLDIFSNAANLYNISGFMVMYSWHVFLNWSA